jgi:hypothetical protein
MGPCDGRIFKITKQRFASKEHFFGINQASVPAAMILGDGKNKRTLYSHQ